MKALKVARIFLLCVGILAAAVLCFCVIRAAKETYSYRKEAHFYEQTAKKYVSVNNEAHNKHFNDSDTQNKNTTQITAPISIDFESLQKINPDIVGWIYCEDTSINYPILHGDTNNEYIHSMYDGSYSNAGSIFIDCRNSGDFSDTETVIYGHNMKNGTMFHELENFLKRDFWALHDQFYIITAEKTYLVKPVAALITSYSSDLKLYQTVNNPEEKWHDKTALIFEKARAFDESASITSGTKLIMLSTCAYEFENARCVLICSLQE